MSVAALDGSRQGGDGQGWHEDGGLHLGIGIGKGVESMKTVTDGGNGQCQKGEAMAAQAVRTIQAEASKQAARGQFILASQAQTIGRFLPSASLSSLLLRRPEADVGSRLGNVVSLRTTIFCTLNLLHTHAKEPLLQPPFRFGGIGGRLAWDPPLLHVLRLPQW